MNDTKHARKKLIKQLKELELEELIKLKAKLINIEETLDNNCKVLDMNKNRRNYVKDKRV